MPEDPVSESEWRTRKQRIDPILEGLGWKVCPMPKGGVVPQLPAALEEFPTANGPADYALGVGGEIVGVVEAKRLTLGPQNALTQSERYARGLPAGRFDFDSSRAPFLYSTNGEVIWFHDVRHRLNTSRRIADFHTPAALQEMLGRDFEADRQRLASMTTWHPRLRAYQIEACQAIEQAIAQRKHQMLVAMATGTGKTFTLVNEVYRLMKSGLGRRVLFLVDRRALAVQAVTAFAAFESEPGHKFNQTYEVYSQRFHREDFDEDEKFDPNVLPSSYLLEPKPGHAFVYVCTIQRMTINLLGRQAVLSLGDEDLDEDASRLDIPIHAFDVVIADECHRGYTTAELSAWRTVLDHFDAVKIGLTATPAAHTKAYFRDVVYRYDYERAVREGHLVDYNVVKIDSDVRINGIFLPEGESVGVVDTQTGTEHMDELEDEREFPTTQIEAKITSPDSNRKIIEEVKKYALEHEAQYGRFPKTLIFAVNDLPHTSHADQLATICREVFGRGEAFVQKITGRVDRPLQRIREFRNRPTPAIAITVDMLSTGVDIPDLEFIVFLRPVKSRILFEQMMGRGTRKGDRFSDKSHFTAFDCFGGTLLEYFKQATAITAEPPDRPVRSIVEVIEDIWANRDRAYNIRCLVKRLQRIDKEMLADAREMFARHVPDGDLGRYAKELPRRLAEDFVGAMGLLRDPDFQNLLQNYPRKPRVFYKAYSVEDTVSSEWLIRDGLGNEHKPEEYLALFARFVRANPEHVEAIRVLLDRPQGWSTDALTELRQKLASVPQRFTEDNLRKAHEACYHKALVDIVSMVKHAAREQEPLLTASQRVDRAFAQVTAGQTFTPDQQRWLDRIREHLAANLTVDRDDFEVVPIFAREGGWRPADRVFGGRLEDLLRRLNEAVAA